MREERSPSSSKGETLPLLVGGKKARGFGSRDACLVFKENRDPLLWGEGGRRFLFLTPQVEGRRGGVGLRHRKRKNVDPGKTEKKKSAARADYAVS